VEEEKRESNETRSNVCVALVLGSVAIAENDDSFCDLQWLVCNAVCAGWQYMERGKAQFIHYRLIFSGLRGRLVQRSLISIVAVCDIVIC